jgi:peroxiredoxin
MSSLKEILSEASAQGIKRISADALAILTESAAQLDANKVGDNALKVGDIIPNVTLTNAQGNATTSAEIFADGPAIITFYRGGWCPYCNLELKAYQALLADIKRLGGTLAAITPEKPDSSLSTTEKNALKFPVLTDTSNKFAKALGLTFEVPAKSQILYKQSFDIDLDVLNGQSGWTLPIPATFVVEKGGKIILADVNRDYRLRLEPSAALTALQSI